MNKINKLFKKAKRINIDDNSKIVIMSDCHRGAGDNFDNFIQNQNIFNAALKYYYNNNFTYIELGDGDEMWEVKQYNHIIEEHIGIFKLLKKFNDQNRFIMIYGNHDIVKRNKKIMEKYFYKYCNKLTNKEEKLLNNLKAYESLVLKYNEHDIFLIHGHQVSFLNSTIWFIARFLVRHIWCHLENIGIKDPTSAARNHKVTKKIERKLKKWSLKNNKIIIIGHTHRPSFPEVGKSLYFNDGACIHPNGVSCLEIENGKITLVKWKFKLSKNNLISIGRFVIDGEIPINDFYKV